MLTSQLSVGDHSDLRDFTQRQLHRLGGQLLTRRCFWGFWSLILVGAGEVLAADVGTFPSDGDRFRLRLGVADGEPPLSARRVTTLEVLISGAVEQSVLAPNLAGPPAPALPVGSLEFTANMPDHGHGLTLRPKIVQKSPDAFAIQGVKLGMAGHWILDLRATIGKEEAHFVVPIDIEP